MVFTLLNYLLLLIIPDQSGFIIIRLALVFIQFIMDYLYIIMKLTFFITFL